MHWDENAQAELAARISTTELRKHKLEATQRLLGSTIAISEQAWQEPSRLPGWTRAHVATHVARNADGFVRSIDAMLSGRRGLMYDSQRLRDFDLERGSERNALALQVDLDTTAGRLSRRFNALDNLGSGMMVELRPGRLFLAVLMPLARLNEVVLHHVDLDCGFEITDLDSKIAALLLEWNIHTIAKPPAARLVAESGLEATVGHVKGPTISGPDEILLGWLTGRLRPETAAKYGLPDQPLLS